MRTKIKKLYDRSECVLSSGHSFLFVTDFEKQKYIELFEERCGHALDDTLLDVEYGEIKADIDCGIMPWGYVEFLDDIDDPDIRKCRIKLQKAILIRKAQMLYKSEKTLKKPLSVSDNHVLEVFHQLSAKNQEAILIIMEDLVVK